MKRGLAVVLVVTACFASIQVLHGAEKSGEALFNEYCSACHAQGGNIINPQKTLYRIDRMASGIGKPQDIVKKMRSPGPRMPRFNRNMISDGDALKIGEYIVKTFN
ncbi:MAG: cytochrome c class [Geobacteraceae bacterium]|nr:MAG: cytochrome c class [Geobacteraceae bacterium]